MCGIFGAVGHSLSETAVGNVLQALRHRGPDGIGVYRDGRAALTLVHTRLAVIDLETGAQPIESADGNLVLVCNGEIYDFERIRKSLEAKGHRFRTRSDSEVIIYLYKEYGLGCFEHLRGEFAFLLYDKAQRLLIAARDRFGIKPLYFSRLPHGLAFASEMKGIFASGLVVPRLDAAGLDPVGGDAEPRFPFEKIEHVPPGCYLTVDLDTCDSRLSRYWSAEIPAATAESLDRFDDAPEEAASAVLAELDEAVRLRLRADVPVGLYLSGGIDSAFVGALMKRNLKSPFHSFSISFPGSDKDEGPLARAAADHLGTEHHELAVTRDMLWDRLGDALWFSELPFVSLAPVGKFLLSEEARKAAKVVLTGEGADEVFLGYRGYFQRALRDTRAGVRASGSARSRRLGLGRVAASVVPRLSLLMFDKSRRRAIAAARAAASSPTNAREPLINQMQESRIAAMPFDILCFLGDREEMAHSLEARLPYLDHRLYDLAKDIPVDLKMRGGVEKAVLRNAADGLLPDEIRLRRKTGFMITSDPVDLFGTDRDRLERLRKYLSREAFARAGVFSLGAYRLLSLVAWMPLQVPLLRRARRAANKAIMYMLQVHMLHEQFVVDPPWQASVTSTGRQPLARTDRELVSLAATDS